MKYSEFVILKELKLVAETLEMSSEDFLKEFGIQEFTPAELDGVKSIILEKTDARSVINFIMGKGSKIRSLGKQLQSAMVGRLTTVLALKNRIDGNDNIDSEHKKKMIDTAKQKEETFKDIEDSIRRKMDDVADSDSRLGKISSVAKSSASVEANKKKLMLLNQIEASENTIAKAKEEQKRREEKLRKSKEAMDDMLKKAKEGEKEKKEEPKEKKDEHKPSTEHEDAEIEDIRKHLDKLREELDGVNEKLKKPMSQQTAQPFEKKKAELTREIHSHEHEKYLMLAKKYSKLGDHEKAKEYEDKAEEHFKKEKETRVPK